MPDLYTPSFHDKIAQHGPSRGFIHLVTVATKPDIIKQAPVAWELANRGELVMITHTGQHHDHRYSGAMLEEFGLSVDIHLAITGDLGDKTAQMIDKFSAVLKHVISLGYTPLPYIHGDTLTSMAIGVASYINRVACVHVEAGIRTVTPRREVLAKVLADHAAGVFDLAAWASTNRDREQFERGSREPFPEQFNTRVSDAGSGYHAAPVVLAQEFLLAEGFPADTIEVVGNTVSDATNAAIRDSERATVFEDYPQLHDGEFVRICIHRRENTEDRARFVVLFEAMEELVRRGVPVLFIRLFGTDTAIDRWGLRERLDDLSAAAPATFISSEVWPNYRDVIAAMRRCSLVATDSGSMQEEMNILGVPCVTLRFGTDRGESLFAGGNVLAPPVDAGFVADVIEGARQLESLRNAPHVYGEDSARQIVDGVLARARPGEGLFRAEEARLGL